MKKVLFSICLIILSLSLHAQVTVGSAEEPVKGSLLQLKSLDSINGSSENAYRGLILPRVTLSKQDQLYPMFLNDPEDPGSGANSEYSADKSEIDQAHTGLVVYNIVENEAEALYAGINMWDGEKWTCLSRKAETGNGFILDCGSIKHEGSYSNTEALNSSNYITLTLDVKKTGTYTITGRSGFNGNPDEDNGYYFMASGEFLTSGNYTLLLAGSGKPKKATPDGGQGDVITFMINGKPLTMADDQICQYNIKVEDKNKGLDFVMDCEKTTVEGTYSLNKPLDGSNTITVWVTTAPDATNNGTCTLTTNTVDGMSFTSSPTTLSPGQSVPIKLNGTGTPTEPGTKRFTITIQNGVNTEKCYANATVAYTEKTIVGLGTASGYGYNVAESVGPMTSLYYYGARKVMNAPANFGTTESSKVKAEGFKFVLGPESPTKLQLEKYINDNKPDIIICGYNTGLSSETAQVLVDYMKNNGIVIFASERDESIRALFSKVLGIQTSAISIVNRGGPGSYYTFKGVDDEVLNGPFGDIRGKYWGEDVTYTRSITGLPEDQIIVYSDGSYNGKTPTANDAKMVTACRLKNYNLIYVGDGGFWSRGLGPAEITSATLCPFYYDNNFIPVMGKYGRVDIYNSVFFANAVAWAIKTAQTNGYNK